MTGWSSNSPLESTGDFDQTAISDVARVSQFSGTPCQPTLRTAETNTPAPLLSGCENATANTRDSAICWVWHEVGCSNRLGNQSIQTMLLNYALIANGDISATSLSSLT